jgi:hypothetical protein
VIVMIAALGLYLAGRSSRTCWDASPQLDGGRTAGEVVFTVCTGLRRF